MSDAVEDPALTSWKAFERRTDGLGGRQTIGRRALARSLAHSLPLPLRWFLLLLLLLLGTSQTIRPYMKYPVSCTKAQVQPLKITL